MEISVDVRVYIKAITSKFYISVLRILELFTREVCIFLKKYATFYFYFYFYFLQITLFQYVCKQAFHISRYISGACISKIKHCYNATPFTYYFYVKTKISVDSHNCISIHLKLKKIRRSDQIHSLFDTFSLTYKIR